MYASRGSLNIKDSIEGVFIKRVSYLSISKGGYRSCMPRPDKKLHLTLAVYSDEVVSIYYFMVSFSVILNVCFSMYGSMGSEISNRFFVLQCVSKIKQDAWHRLHTSNRYSRKDQGYSTSCSYLRGDSFGKYKHVNVKRKGCNLR